MYQVNRNKKLVGEKRVKGSIETGKNDKRGTVWFKNHNAVRTRHQGRQAEARTMLIIHPNKLRVTSQRMGRWQFLLSLQPYVQGGS